MPSVLPRLEGSDREALQTLLAAFFGEMADGGGENLQKLEEESSLLAFSERLGVHAAAEDLIATAEEFVFAVRRWQNENQSGLGQEGQDGDPVADRMD